MRQSVLFAVLLLSAAGCGGSSATSATPTVPPVPTLKAPLQWPRPPAMSIDPTRPYSAVVVTSDGAFTIRLLPNIAPRTVNNFVFLARHHFYDHVIFHRIVQTEMVQTGDPLGTGFGGPGYTFKGEKVPPGMKYTVGAVAMANSGPNTNGSQFFIVTGPGALSLKPDYTIFGKVTSGMSVVQTIAASPVQVNPGSGEISEPVNDIYMKSVTIH